MAVPFRMLPKLDDRNRFFWTSGADGRLRFLRCQDCGFYVHPPTPRCPKCWGERVEWAEASGRATLYTWSVVHVNDLPPFPERVPYVAAIVELDEGPRMMTNVVDCDFDALRVGMPVEVTFRPTSDEFTLPQFRPAPV